MSANIPETKLVSELLKPTGFNCPTNLEGKTFTEATQGGTSPTLYYWGRPGASMLTNFSPDSFVEDDAMTLSYTSDAFVKRKLSDAYVSAVLSGDTLSVTTAMGLSFTYTYDSSKNVSIW